MYVQQRRRECTANNSKLLHEFMSENFPPSLLLILLCKSVAAAGPTLLLTISQLLQQLATGRDTLSVRSLVSFSCRALLLWWCRLGIPQFLSSFPPPSHHPANWPTSILMPIRYIFHFRVHTCRSLKYLSNTRPVTSPREVEDRLFYLHLAAQTVLPRDEQAMPGGDSQSMQCSSTPLLCDLQWGRMLEGKDDNGPVNKWSTGLCPCWAVFSFHSTVLLSSPL